MKSILELSSQQLRRAAQIKEQITALENQLQSLLGQSASVARTGGGGMSPAARAKISAALKARWASRKAAQGQAKSSSTASGRKSMSAAQKAKIAAAMKARWAKIKAAKSK